MLALLVALIALSTPFVTVGWVPGNSTVGNDYIVDLGYQLNQGQAVVVRLVRDGLLTASYMYPVAATDPKFTKNSAYHF